MARRAFRDRFFTPPVARAIMSPLGILLAGAGAAAGILLSGPFAGAVLGVVAWAGRVAAAVPRNPTGDRVDPFTLGEPWRRFVQDAVQAQSRFARAVDNARSGPLRERLKEIADRVDDGVQECWRVAQRGEAMANARSQIDIREAQRDLAEIAGQEGGRTTWAPGSATQRTVEALQAQLASADRMDRLIDDTRDRLRLLDARLDEAVARAIELSVQAADVADLGGLGDDVENVVTEMEALRQGLEEASDTVTPGDLPSPGQTATGTA